MALFADTMPAEASRSVIENLLRGEQSLPHLN